MWNKLINYVSGEWILRSRDNGGSIIFLRTLISSSALFLSALAIINFIDPGKSWSFSSDVLRSEIIKYFPWFGAIFAAVYAALYARFAAQWSYLANLYNMIKKTTMDSEIDQDALAEWKAAFIEDAEYLHLARKENFASIIYAWGHEEIVKEKYINYTPGGGR